MAAFDAYKAKHPDHSAAVQGEERDAKGGVNYNANPNASKLRYAPPAVEEYSDEEEEEDASDRGEVHMPMMAQNSRAAAPSAAAETPVARYMDYSSDEHDDDDDDELNF